MQATKKQLTNFYFDDSIQLIFELEKTCKLLSEYKPNNEVYQQAKQAIEKTKDFYSYQLQHCPSQEVKTKIINHLN